MRAGHHRRREAAEYGVDHLGGHSLDRVPAQEALSERERDVTGGLRLPERARDRARKSGWIFAGHEAAPPLLAQGLTNRRDVRGHDGDLEAHGLKQDAAQPLQRPGSTKASAAQSRSGTSPRLPRKRTEAVRDRSWTSRWSRAGQPPRPASKVIGRQAGGRVARPSRRTSSPFWCSCRAAEQHPVRTDAELPPDVLPALGRPRPERPHRAPAVSRPSADEAPSTDGSWSRRRTTSRRGRSRRAELSLGRRPGLPGAWTVGAQGHHVAQSRRGCSRDSSPPAHLRVVRRADLQRPFRTAWCAPSRGGQSG